MKIDFGPPQPSIDLERLRAMLEWHPRRWRLADWEDPLQPPGTWTNKDWYLCVPFRESFVPSFEAEHLSDHVPFAKTKNSDTAHRTFLKDVADEQVMAVQAWLEAVSDRVAIRDCLCASWALDYDREAGNPKHKQTEIAALRLRAKPYGGKPSLDTFAAADDLAARCLGFLKSMAVYKFANAVAAVPSRLNKSFDLPTYIAKKVAVELKVEDLTAAVRTIKQRPEMKKVSVAAKLDVLVGTIEAEAGAFRGKSILLLDDLYQSGASMNYCAMVLLEQGANRVVGLACEKTCRNDDNVSSR